ncbi:TetR/AcrR family transcriptional regulator [Trujillonella endophytica]|nr:TetR/AcrR family transcriptional regulator [Trujillella endophytica]
MTAPARPSAARERLLRTAAELFYAEGLHTVGVDRIVSAAGITRATFYRHFPGKTDLVVAYLRGIDDLVRAYVGGPPAGRDEAVAQLRRLTEAIAAELCRPDFRGCPFINAAAEHPDPADPVHRAVAEHRAWLAGTVTSAFRLAGHPDPEEAGRRYVMLRDGAMVAAYLGDAPAAAATLSASAQDLLAAA